MSIFGILDLEAIVDERLCGGRALAQGRLKEWPFRPSIQQSLFSSLGFVLVDLRLIGGFP
jgi:hypothetical protein